jgi:hypothetical protein
MKEYNFETSLVSLSQFEYVKKMGAYKPSFAGIPDDYYPLTACEVALYSIFVIAIIGSALGMLIGFTFWTRAAGLEGYIIVWSFAAILFAIIMMILFYVGGKGRIREEK